MVDFTTWSSSTHPVVRLENDYNNILDHAFEKTAVFIIRKNGSVYEALVGGTSSLAGTIFYGGADNVGGVTGTDAQAVVQAAGDAASSLYGGGIVALKGATYTFDGAVTMSAKNNVHFVGDGESTFITQANSADITHFFNWLNCTYGGLHRVQIDGNGGNQTGGTTAVEINGTSNKIRISECSIVDMYNIGIEIGGTANHNWIVDNYFNDCDNNAVSITYGSQTAGYNTIHRNHIYQCSAFGVGTVKADRNTISDNIITQLNTATLNEGINLDRSSYNRVLGNVVSYTGDAGIVIHTSNNATPISYGNIVANNEVYYCKFMGIHVHDYAQRNKVIGNVVWNNNQDDDQVNEWSGIVFDEATCTYNTILDNTVFDTQTGVETQTYGIHVHNSSDYNLIRNNDCRNNLTGPYFIVAGNNTADETHRTSTSVDLSGAAETIFCFHTPVACHLMRATLFYTEASSADAGVTIEIGKETDRDYYYTGTSEVNKAQYYTSSVTLLKNDIAAGDTVTFYSAGGKVGTGEIMLVIDVLVGA
jgi:parallel beta-helix repeat protein